MKKPIEEKKVKPTPFTISKLRTPSTAKEKDDKTQVSKVLVSIQERPRSNATSKDSDCFSVSLINF